jgi:hypothetical protein
MDGLRNTEPGRAGRTRRSYAQFGPVLWIAILLAIWFLIGEWKMLPDIIGGTMAALP